MNLQDLLTKLKRIDEGAPVAPVHTDGPAEKEGIIIGGPMGLPGMMGHQDQPKQPDTVTMNVSLNGSGPGGVKDLMSILRDIESGVAHHSDHEPDHSHGEPLFGAEEERMSEVIDDDKEGWGNSAEGGHTHHTHGIDAVTFHGDDMNSKGSMEPHKKQGGGNPYNESLVNRLSAMYQAIKEERTEEKDEKGNVIKWKEETPWRKAQDKNGRGKVTNMSDKARRESEKMANKNVKENAHSDDDEEKKIRHLMRKYGWSRQEALEHFHYEKHDPKDYEDMEESTINESNEILRLSKMLNG